MECILVIPDVKPCIMKTNFLQKQQIDQPHLLLVYFHDNCETHKKASSVGSLEMGEEIHKFIFQFIHIKENHVSLLLAQ